MKICYNCFNDIPDSAKICPRCGSSADLRNGDKYPYALPCGSVLNGRYIVGRVLGQGGFGITYAGQQYDTKQPVAIKEYFPGVIASRNISHSVIPFSVDKSGDYEYGKKQFLDEAKTLSAFIGSPNIVRVFGYFEENGTAYFVMEYVEGRNLRQYIADRGGRISWEETWSLLMPVLDALSEVHYRNIIHRDIKPDNIIITNSGNAKLIDFGAARYNHGEKSKSLTAVLTPGYAPLEQYFTRGRQGPWTDVYALAATIYFCITGKVPIEAVERSVNDDLKRPSELGVSILDHAETALMKALSVREEDRYRSTYDFRNAVLEGMRREGEKTDGTGTGGSGTPAPAGEGSGQESSREDSYRRALDLALQGDPDAQYLLGSFYESGKGVQQSDELAQKWYRRAAAQGNTAARTKLSLFAEKDSGEGQDKGSPGTGRDNNRKRVEAKDGRLIEEAKNKADERKREEEEKKLREQIEKDIKEKAKKEERDVNTSYSEMVSADKSGNNKRFAVIAAAVIAAAVIVYMLSSSFTGSNTLRNADPVNAAADNKDQEKTNYTNTTDDNISQLPYEEIVSRASSGDMEAQYEFGIIFLYGNTDVDQDYQEAFTWFTRAAEQGNTRAQNALGNMYADGQGVEQNYEKSFEWFSKAAEQEYSIAQYNLGQSYRQGKGTSQSYEKAFEWFSRAAEQGLAEAQVELAVMYYKGNGVDRSYEKAFEWSMKAAEQGNAQAQTQVGVLYENGLGVDKNIEKAIEWYTKAAEQGYEEAKNNLKTIRNSESNKRTSDTPMALTDTWEEIAAASRDGTYKERYRIGDTKELDMGSEGIITMKLVAMDEDELADGSGKAPMTWVADKLLQSEHNMNSEATNEGGWEASEMRARLRETVLPLMPTEVRNNILEVTKYSYSVIDGKDATS